LHPGQTDASGLKCRAVLKGFLYVPKGVGKHAVIVWNHDSSQARISTGVPGLSPDKADPAHDTCRIARFFVDRGYIFFVPQRRGTGMSTGVYVSDWIDSLASKEGTEVALAMVGPKLMEQTEDVNEAVKFIARSVGADKNRIAVMGHSYGGMVSLFSAIKLKNIRAAVDSAGGGLSWDGNLQLRMYLQAQTPFVGGFRPS
jgi:dienelactone hydrolase